MKGRLERLRVEFPWLDEVAGERGISVDELVREIDTVQDSARSRLRAFPGDESAESYARAFLIPGWPIGEEP